MFPAGAGMNRIDADVSPTEENVPRRRGDESSSFNVLSKTIFMFPAGVGMNRCVND